MEKLKKFEFKATVQSKYPWDKYLDGGIYKITEGPEGDYQCSTRNMGGKIRTAAKKRYKNVKVSVNEKEKFIVFQASDMTPEQRKIEDARRAAAKARGEAEDTSDDTGAETTGGEGVAE